MNKTVLYTALIALALPMALNAIGLGGMNVKSSLDQPFLAEIELIDVGIIPLSAIKAEVAVPEHFRQMGLNHVIGPALLNLKIEKNSKGRPLIKAHSMERMNEPYIELVVNFRWPGGQLYKVYSVLLDPLGYQLAPTPAPVFLPELIPKPVVSIEERVTSGT